MNVVDRDKLVRVDRVPYLVFVFFGVVLAIAGGGSRADILGQAIVRGVAAAIMIATVLFLRPARIFEYRMVALLLLAAGILVAAQLVPLPPALWTALPGRGVFMAAMSAAGIPQPWRPLDLVPDAGLNALFSLMVPAAMLTIIASLTRRGSERLLLPLLLWIVASALFSLVQAAGAAPDNPFINGTLGEYAGFFANRNHQAMSLAIGIVLTIFWCFERAPDWRSQRTWLAFVTVALLFLSILVAGSRSGLLLGVFGLLFSLPLAQPGLFAKGRRRRGLITLASAAAFIGGMMLLSIYTGRALSIDRVTSVNLDSEFRIRAFPTVWGLVQTYFPAGAGFGSFDAVFRAAEPFDLLETTYFNHAHNDFLELVLEGGLPALLILVAAAAALARSAFVVFVTRNGGAPGVRHARLGFLIILIMLGASLSDYPARTPVVMCMLIIAGCWLNRGARPVASDERSENGTLPRLDDPL